MSGRADLDSLVAALEERLGMRPGEPFSDRLTIAFEGGQRAEAVLRPDGETIALTAPVEGAHDGLPQEILHGLLASNAFGGDLAGGILRVRNGGDTLEIANIVPTNLGAAAIANLMINQANAAGALAGSIAADVVAFLNSGQAQQGER